MSAAAIPVARLLKNWARDARCAAKDKIRSRLEASPGGYRLLLRVQHGCSGPHGRPDAPWHNAVLASHAESERAVVQVRKLGLPVIHDRPKNWDSLAALDLIVRSTGRDARIFDAGAEMYSMMLPWLALYGYRNLLGGNLAFKEAVRKGPIVYRFCDITQSTLPTEQFDAVTCLSVIEHGVGLEAYFREMSRILKPGGLLITSTDYWEEEVDTRGQIAYGVRVHVFSRREMEAALAIAARYGLTLTAPLDLRAREKAVHWARYDLDYTFVVFSLRKSAATRPAVGRHSYGGAIERE